MDLKITQLDENTTPASTDVLAIVDDPSGSPVTQKVEVETLATSDYFNVNSLARQAIINGNFDVWQRGTSVSNPADSSFLTDRWRTRLGLDGGTDPTLVHSQQALTPGDIPNSYYHYRIAPNGAGSGYGDNSFHEINQHIEYGTRLLCGLNKKVTVSFYARSSIANKKLGVWALQTYGTGGTPSSGEVINGTFWTLTSSWTKYTYTFTTNTLVGKTFGTANDDYFRLAFRTQWGSGLASQVGDSVAETFVGSGNIDIAQVQLCAGDVALPFMPKSYGDELRTCQRYYYRITADAPYSRFGYGVAPNANEINVMIIPKVSLRALPTLSYSNLANLQASDTTAAVTSLTTFTLNTNTYSKEQMHCTITKNASFTALRSYYIESSNSAGEWIAFEAEL